LPIHLLSKRKKPSRSWGRITTYELEIQVKKLSSLKEVGVRYAGPCHCSGDLARQLFKIAYGDGYIDAGVGRIIKFE
jgi:metal-dependent hydrolase (beta-lactamase superfamily II)